MNDFFMIDQMNQQMLREQQQLNEQMLMEQRMMDEQMRQMNEQMLMNQQAMMQLMENNAHNAQNGSRKVHRMSFSEACSKFWKWLINADEK